jgi:hypothetical protein
MVSFVRDPHLILNRCFVGSEVMISFVISIVLYLSHVIFAVMCRSIRL